ncbi:hypothetical protein RPMA_19385 [Tardiphaga alba]|uniref:UrcA family protein n=1 Tax=Tardiphaga alba TaxID=340268 RepID=A0ABX8AAF8_9BRAD|nr:hypothetical protein RPMA_19385 [Tardiphaga alba]
MKKFAFAIAAAVTIGLASLVSPASATTITIDKTNVAAPLTDFSSQHRHYHRGPHHARRTTVIRRGPVCTVRTVVKRGPYGRRVVNKVRVCR